MQAFIENLEDTVFATEEQRKKEIWDVEGRLKNGNQVFKFDVRPLKHTANSLEKTGFFNTKADKMVFEDINQWVIFDTEELHKYVKSQDKKDFNIKELLKELSWNLKINK